jgi:hypothetical protein
VTLPWLVDWIELTSRRLNGKRKTGSERKRGVVRRAKRAISPHPHKPGEQTFAIVTPEMKKNR